MYNLESLLILDVEANGLWKPTEIHLVCGRDWNGKVFEFRNPQKHIEELRDTISKYEHIGGHNFLGYDLFVLDNLLGDLGISRASILDTLVVSRLLRYDIAGGHSLESWGERLGVKKQGVNIKDWSVLTDEMVSRCHSDTQINLGIVKKYQKYLLDPHWEKALSVEHSTALTCRTMTETGFPINLVDARKLHDRLSNEIEPIDQNLAAAFPPLAKPVREITPRATKSGTISMQDFRWFEGPDLSCFTVDAPFTRIEWEAFNPGSPKQIVSRLNSAGWKPTEKTKGHIEALKDKGTLPDTLERYAEYGWKVSETNLKTLPQTAPKAARDLAKRIVLQSRVSDLEEWISLAKKGEGHDDPETYRIHGQFNSIGAWTHRLSHAKPNLANIPVANHKDDETDFEREVNRINDQMRALFSPRQGYRLIGTDADGVQMRIFAHYVNDPELIDALVKGRKEDGTDIHSLHRRKLGEPCKGRADAKTFIYAWLLGAGVGKVSQILGCSQADARRAVEGFIESYPALARLKRTQIPQDAKRGYFEGLDGRYVACSSEHLMLSGYLQNGEAIIMKGACREWQHELQRNKIPYELYTWPHDEWQTGVPDDPELIAFVQNVQIDSIRHQADRLNLNCPLEGSSGKGMNWQETH